MTETLNWDHTMVDVTNLQDAIDYFNSKGLAFTLVDITNIGEQKMH
ncbi:hypothetical protein [Limosilactobacillus reuteri]|nr:hypothetical protein [Limosilactobacillus reuteri]